MTENDYIIRYIPKRSGGFRVIHEPRPALKQKQRGILRWLNERGIRTGAYAHGFVRNRSTFTHAKLHVGKKLIIKLDIENFFATTSVSMLRNALAEENLKAEYISEIIEVCTLNGVLPQGAPTSPFLSNIAVKKMDRRLAGLARKYNAVYSRYADDMCFSSDNPHLNNILPAVEYAVRNSGYKLNSRKTKILRQCRRQIVTGVVVNEKANIPRELQRNTRARLHNFKMRILNNQVFDEAEYESIKGLLSYFLSLRPDKGTLFRKDIKEIERLITLKYRPMAA